MTDLADTTDQPTGDDAASPQVPDAMPDSSKPGLPAAPDGSSPDTAADAAAQPASPTAAQATPSASTDPQSTSPFAATAEAPQPPDLAARLAAVQQIADPHLRQATEANIRLITQGEINAFTDQQRNAKAQAKAIIDQGGGLTAIPVKLLLAIDQPGRQALQNYALAHGNPHTDPVTYYGLKNQALDDPAGFQAVDLSNHMAELDAKDYADLTKLQNDLRSGQLPADFSLQQVYKLQTDRLLQQLGLPSGNATTERAAANQAPQPSGQQPGDATGTGAPTSGAADAGGLQSAAQMRRDVDRQIAAYEAATGRRLSPADQRDLLEELRSQQAQKATPPAPSKPATSTPSATTPSATTPSTTTPATTQPEATQPETTSGNGPDAANPASPTNNTQAYGQQRFDLLAHLEGNRPLAYDDATGKTVDAGTAKSGKITVGVGFNMDRPGAREAFAKYLPGVSFDDVYAGKRALTEQESRSLLDYTAQEAEHVVDTKLAGADLAANERLALVSLAFNTPALIGPHLIAATKRGDTTAVLDEILNNSNKTQNKGLASRRWQEAAMFAGPARQDLLPAYADYMKQFQ